MLSLSDVTFNFENLYSCNKTFSVVTIIIIVAIIVFIINREYTKYFII